MKVKAILVAASALTLIGAPSAFAQHHHNGGGHHAAAARQGGGSHRARAAHARRTVSRRPARHTTVRRTTVRRTTRHTVSRRAVTRHAAVHGRNVSRRSTVVRASRIGGAQHWRHATRVAGRWGRGSRLPVSYWRSHRWVDWRAHRLWAPPRGYNWVLVNGNYVLLAITTGIIADIVLANSYY